ncbi:MAG: OmpA family protein, partial [Eubacteriales bacterium]|nr:OmpA family protein [Eubacteriales bacterium]
TQAELDEAKALLTEQQQQLVVAQALLTDQQLVVAQQQDLLDSQQAQLDELVGVRKRIITSLADELAAADISATVDPATGAITLDSSILFTRSEYTLSEAGKKMIDEFLPVYLNVLLSDEYRGNIAEIIIEGHTDSVGSYMSNLELSQNRALAVARYVLSDEYDSITPETKKYLRQIITANGRSWSNLIYDENGVEDADASRRVEFKFRLQDEQMIEQMAQLLEDFEEAEATVGSAQNE